MANIKDNLVSIASIDQGELLFDIRKSDEYIFNHFNKPKLDKRGKKYLQILLLSIYSH